MGIRENFLTAEKNTSWNILHGQGAESLLWEILKNRLSQESDRQNQSCLLAVVSAKDYMMTCQSI